jgi:hypothetical protein
MRKVVYSVATSLDGFIAGPIGELDWIVMDSDFDFNEVFQKFDTILVGRKTFEPMAASGQATMPGMTTLVFSRTLRPADHPDVTLVASDAVETVNALRSQPGKDIWRRFAFREPRECWPRGLDRLSHYAGDAGGRCSGDAAIGKTSRTEIRKARVA